MHVTLDEATAGFLAQMAESGAKPLHEMTPTEARALTAQLGQLFGPGPDMARVDDTTVDGTFPVRVLVPHHDPRGVILWYHGGGWVIGTIDEADTLGRILAERTACAVVLVDYRLAPEHRYPAAAEDAWAALRWVDGHLDEIAGSRVPVIVAGDSAGGNLSAVVAQRAKREGAPEVALQVLVYPVTDADLDTASYLDPDNQLLLSRDAMIWFWDLYAPDPGSRRNVDASPLREPDLSGVAPAVVLTAEHDPLRDEGEAYARRLGEAGVPVSHRRFDGQMHAFFTLVNVLPASAAGIDYVVEAVDRALSAHRSPP